MLSYNVYSGEVHNYWACDHMHNAPMGRPLVVLDMYEHAYHMDYGASAAKYVDAFMQMFRIFFAAFLFLSGQADVQGQRAAKTRKATKRVSVVVFVCEHGSAKSVIAAAHFNKLASDRNLNLRAISRGTNPDQEIAPKAAEGLSADGLAVDREKPKKLSRADVSKSVRVVAFCVLPDAYKKGIRVEQWNDMPAVSEDYNKARDAIVARIRHLLDKLRSAK